MVDILRCPIAPGVRLRCREGIGIERGLVREGKNLTADGVQDDDTAPGRVVLVYRGT